MARRITISVDADVAEVYLACSDADRRKLDVLVNLQLRDATRSGKSLKKIMLEISRNARQRGPTPEILQSILAE